MENLQELVLNYKSTENEETFNIIYNYYIENEILNKVSIITLGFVDEDLIQELSMLLYESLLRYDVNSNATFSTYFYKVSKYHAKKYVKENIYYNGNCTQHYFIKFSEITDKLNKNKKLTYNESLIYNLINLDNVNYNEDYCNNNNEENFNVLVSTIIGALDKKELKIIDMLIGNSTYKDISKELNVSAEMVRKYIIKIREKLKELV